MYELRGKPDNAQDQRSHQVTLFSERKDIVCFDKN